MGFAASLSIGAPHRGTEIRHSPRFEWRKRGTPVAGHQPHKLSVGPRQPKGVCMTRAELLEAASERLSEAIILLTAAGEDCLAFEVEAIADRVDFSAVPVAVQKRAGALER